MHAQRRFILAAAFGLIANAAVAAETTIADYLQKGWDIKAAWEGGMVLQKADQAVMCYFTGDVATKDRGNYMKNVRTVACSPIR